MFNNFISSLHFSSPSEKMKSSWCYEAVQSLWHNTSNRNLLYGKKVNEIQQYSSGDIDMRPFLKMFKSLNEEANKQNNPNYINNLGVDKYNYMNPLPLIPAKLNSAVATMQKIPMEITVKALDALAVKKKKEDLNFLKNKPKIEADLQVIADQLQLGEVDLGTTKYSSIPYSSSPYGLDLNEPDELQVFVDLLYNLSVESSFETALQIFLELQNILQLRLMETHSQLKYGVSCHCAFESDITGLPDKRYIYPGAMEVPYSELPDMSDRTHEFENMRPTIMELFNMFGSEIKNKETLEKIINEDKFGYCSKNGCHNIEQKDWGTFKTNLIYCKVKSVDWVGVKSVVNSDGELYYELTDKEEESHKKIWAQNTYSFYWLKNTKYFFKIDKLGFAHRKEGQEQYQGFDTNIYKSQEKSAVEQSIGENKKAQVASIKMEHAIIKSLPAGKVIDLKGIRNAMEGLKDEANEYTMSKLITMAFEENNIIIDTEGFEGKNDGQLKPFYEIPGGIKSEVVGYMQVIADANSKIAQFTGINEQLTGTSANPEGLIGLQKLLINSSINSLYYIQEALTSQLQKLMNIWSFIIKEAVDKGGTAKEAIVNLIGKEKTEIIDGLEDLPLHSMGVKITLTQREEERARFDAKVNRLLEQGILSIADEYMLDSIQNPKDKVALLAVKEKQFRKRQQAAEQQKFQQQQQLLQQQGQNMQGAIQTETQGDIEKIYAKGEVQAKITTLASQLGLTEKQLDGLLKRTLQRDRGIDQERKAISTIDAKANAQAQTPLL